ncbi:hypothetical protein A9K97_gp221 [Tokyovirus A1]|uniref:hypothetical protein n=1 Tax=Tokyovirus A1 TaxID=1826170 RepID=UPI0007A9865B|nr:hypothetical protein A9K97_gp221 [Tokyovirus A1]BAU80130.1 hypothetical protein [Tokyovirus A1]
MSKSKRATEPKLSEDESTTDNSESEEELVVEKPKKKAAPKKKTATKKASAPKKEAAPKKTAAPPAEKKPRKPKAAPAKEEIAEEEETVEATPKKTQRREKKPPVLKQGHRSFRIVPESIEPAVDVSLLKGNDLIVHSTAPLQAGRKTFTRLLKKYKDSEVVKYRYEIVEDTEGRKKIPFSYEGERVKRDEPHVVVRGGSSYTVNYDNIVKAVKRVKASE